MVTHGKLTHYRLCPLARLRPFSVRRFLGLCDGRPDQVVHVADDFVQAHRLAAILAVVHHILGTVRALEGHAVAARVHAVNRRDGLAGQLAECDAIVPAH